MGSKSDKIKGRIKEAVGVLADDDSLKREGQRDQAVGEVKETVEQAAQQVKDQVKRAAEKVKEKAKKAVQKVKDA
ncbi:MAG TPA: CsbD family protein [Candidatus Tectomicrobia bacterium]|nr:CsbD family protein [Candidatus Tectomicrobia bacterium]